MARWTVLLALTGCHRLDPAPADVDGLTHLFWAGWSAEEDARLAEAVANADVAIAAAAEDPIDGTLTDLTAEEAALVPVEGDPDPALAAGFFVGTHFACGLDRLQELVIALDQDVLYEGAYDAYDRTYTADDAAFVAGDAATLTWDITLESSLLGASFTEDLSGGVRRVPTDLGPALVQRTWLLRPAEFEGSGKSFDQDYQIEAYWETSPGTIAHLYGLWREFDYGGGFTQDNGAAIGIVVGNLKKWDEGTAELCAQ